MSQHEFAEEIKANIERAKQAVGAAKKLSDEGYYDFCAARAYYAVFYAATALLLSNGLEFRKHSGVIAAIHKNFIKTGVLPKQIGKDLNWLFEIRSVGDYGMTIHVPQEEAHSAIEAAENIVNVLVELLDK